MNAVLPFAQEMLSKHRAFHPFGAAINTNCPNDVGSGRITDVDYLQRAVQIAIIRNDRIIPSQINSASDQRSIHYP